MKPIKAKSHSIYLYILFATLSLGYSQSSLAGLIPVDLYNFYADSTVSVAIDGATATLTEDPAFSSVLLSNDPGLGDPQVIFGGVGASIMFDYVFSEPIGNDDVFTAFLLDGNTGLSFGSAFEFFTTDAGSGTVSFDLSSLVGEVIGLQFELASNMEDLIFTSTVTISNVKVSTPDITVPEPGILLLFGFGLLLVAWSIHKQGILQKKQSSIV